MRLVIQKVSQSNVKVDGKIVGEIGKGYMVLVGITEGDDEKIVDKMVDKLVNLRIFEDTENKMNLSLIDIGGSILSISQFTLYANCKKGRRPSFVEAAKPEIQHCPPNPFLYNDTQSAVLQSRTARWDQDRDKATRCLISISCFLEAIPN